MVAKAGNWWQNSSLSLLTSWVVVVVAVSLRSSSFSVLASRSQSSFMEFLFYVGWSSLASVWVHHWRLLSHLWLKLSPSRVSSYQRIPAAPTRKLAFACPTTTWFLHHLASNFQSSCSDLEDFFQASYYLAAPRSKPFPMLFFVVMLVVSSAWLNIPDKYVWMNWLIFRLNSELRPAAMSSVSAQLVLEDLLLLRLPEGSAHFVNPTSY